MAKHVFPISQNSYSVHIVTMVMVFREVVIFAILTILVLITRTDLNWRWGNFAIHSLFKFLFLMHSFIILNEYTQTKCYILLYLYYNHKKKYWTFPWLKGKIIATIIYYFPKFQQMYGIDETAFFQIRIEISGLGWNTQFYFGCKIIIK